MSKVFGVWIKGDHNCRMIPHHVNSVDYLVMTIESKIDWKKEWQQVPKVGPMVQCKSIVREES